jgi:hypothetical protein
MSTVALEIAPLTEAVGRMDRKMPIARALTSEEWAGVPLALRERAFWTARFAKADVLQVMHEAIGDRLKLERRESVPGRGEVTMSRDNFIAEMRDRLAAAGYVPPQGKAGTIQDLTSTGRLGLIFDMNTQMAQGYARWKSGQLEGALQAFPAQELYRAESRVVPRNWIERWRAAGGQVYNGGRLIAAKDDAIWTEISAFGTPWPPFDFNSGMDVRDVSRAEAERLGVIAAGRPVQPPAVEFNANLAKSVEGYAPEIRETVLRGFGDQVVVEAGVARWKQNAIEKFVERAVAEPDFKAKMSLGEATTKTVDAAAPLADLSGYVLQLTADEARHAMKRHGEGRERRKDQIGLTPADFAVLADLWRSPDQVLPGQNADALQFLKTYGDTLTMVTWRMNSSKREIYVHTLWKKKGGGAS